MIVVWIIIAAVQRNKKSENTRRKQIQKKALLSGKCRKGGTC
jgi:hypothetical protein